MKIITLLVFSLAFNSCKESAVSKIKPENIKEAQKRDTYNNLYPVATFDKVEFDFGTINEGDIVETTYVVTNTGKSDLVIIDAKASCGCTVPILPREAVKVGDYAKIGVKFDSRGKKNKQSKTITLTTNTLKGKEILKIKGFITPKTK